jgi:hypothetical protein
MMPNEEMKPSYAWYSDDTVLVVKEKDGSFTATAIDGIGDINSTAKGSGARYNSGKADFSLIPLSTLEDEARVWEYGTRKYNAWNWAKGMPWSVPYACAMRHLSAWQRGEEIDPESNLPHLAHVMCNIRMLILYAKTYPEGDDRPPRELMP